MRLVSLELRLWAWGASFLSPVFILKPVLVSQALFGVGVGEGAPILPLCAHVLYRAFEKYKCQGSTPRDNDSFWNGVQTSVFVQSPPGDSEHGQLRENW